MALDYAKDGRIAVFTLNRPEVRNAVNVQLLKEFNEALLDFRDDDNLWVGILTGAGDTAFCAGADVKEFLPFVQKAHDRPWIIPPVLCQLELWKPLIAAINGYAFGGGLEMAMQCDIRIAAEHAKMGQLEVTVGMMPGNGGSQRLPRLVPLCIAAEMLFTGKAIDAQEAYRIGLVNKVVPLEQLMPTAREIAEAICKTAPPAVRATKQAMYQGLNMDLEQGLQLEQLLVRKVQSSEDYAEGTRAFAEKRKPVWKGK